MAFGCGVWGVQCKLLLPGRASRCFWSSSRCRFLKGVCVSGAWFSSARGCLQRCSVCCEAWWIFEKLFPAFLQTLMIRDWWMCMIISVMFEFLEYSLEHQLPNFSECWWDHVRTAQGSVSLSKCRVCSKGRGCKC